MSRTSLVLVASFCSLAACVSPTTAAAAERPVLGIGQPAPDFDLPGADGKNHRLSDFADAKVLVVIFTCNHCPTAQAYEDRMIKMHCDYRDRGVVLVAISPNDPLAVRLDELGYTDVGDSLEDMKIRAKDKGFEFPYLYDGKTQKISAAFGVKATPHVYIFDAKRRLQYVGRIDDSDIAEVKSHDARNAINALLAGKKVPVATTKVFGCSTKWAEKRPSARESIERWNQEEVSLQTIDLDGVKELAKNNTEKLRVVNIWATWCGPCVEELADLTTVHRMYRKRKFEMITISVDEPGDTATAEKTPAHLSCQNYRFDNDDRYALMDALDPKSPGPVPYTVVIAPGGKIVYRSDGPFEPQVLKKAIADTLGRTYASR